MYSRLIILLSTLSLWTYSYIQHFSVLLKNAVYVPLGDILDHLKLLKEPTLHAIFAPHNEHKIVWTKLQMLLFYHLNGMNFESIIIFNFVLYAIIVLITPFLMVKWVSFEAGIIALLFSIVQLSPQASEIHAQIFNGQWHFATFFALIGAAIISKRTIQNALCGSLLLIASMYSVGVGFGYAAGILLVYSLVSMFTKDKKIVSAWLIAAGITGASAYLWKSSAANEAMKQTMPWESGYWDFFFNMISYGFGITNTNSLYGEVLFALILLPIAITIFQRYNVLTRAEIFLISIISGVLIAIALISVGRATGGAQMAKSLRYYETVSLLVPTTAVLWYLTLKCYRKIFIALFAGLIGYLSYQSWRYNANYDMYRVLNAQVTGCYNAIFVKNGPPVCPYGYLVSDWRPFIDTIKSLNLDFVKKLHR